ncbi:MULTISPECIES: hypothetical protein [unclassified Microcoleus]
MNAKTRFLNPQAIALLELVKKCDRTPSSFCVQTLLAKPKQSPICKVF